MRENSKNKNRILIAGNYTVDPLKESIDYWTGLFGICCNVLVQDYNQIFQHLLQFNSDFYTGNSIANIVLIRLEDWLPYEENPKAQESGEKQKHLKETVEKFVEALCLYQRNGTCNMLLMLTASTEKFAQSETWREVWKEAIAFLKEKVSQLPIVELIVVEEYVKKYHIEFEEIHDSVRNEIGHVPYTDQYYALLGTLVMRYLYWQTGSRFKVIVADCDQTLWGGVCAETGHENLVLNGCYKKFHQFLLRQKEMGMLLCICSKNNEKDVYQVFNREDMIMTMDDFAATRINWENKASNIEQIARDLGLGLNSFIFIDDNPVECSMMKSSHKEVLTIQWPEDDAKKLLLMEHVWEFDHYSITDEDLNRNKMMLENKNRMDFKQTTTDFCEFIQQLKLKIDFEDVSEETILRTAQLTKKTNQFNFTALRENEGGINKYRKENGKVITVRVEDRFGDYGIVGVMMVRQKKKEFIVDNILLSCRVLGRGAEYQMLSYLGTLAGSYGCEKVTIKYIRTEKNTPVGKFIEEVCGQCHAEKLQSQQCAQEYRFSAEKLAEVTFKPDQKSDENVMKNETITAAFTEKTDNKSTDCQLMITDELREKIVYEYSNIRNFYQDQKRIQQNYDYVLALVKGIFSSELKIPASSIDERASMAEYLNNSMQVLEITSKLMKEYSNVSSASLYEADSIEGLVRMMIGFEPAIEERSNHAFVNQDNASESADEDIAIIGMSGTFPMAKNIEDLWNNLLEGNGCISVVPEKRWDLERYYDSTGEKMNKSHSKWGGFIEGIDKFDSSFFSISKNEANYMDPQQRLFLQCVWNLLEDACYTLKTIPRDTGVFVGAISNDYNILASEAAKDGRSAYRNSEMYQLSNRISYHFDLHGPSMTIDTACSSSATAVYLAYQCLKAGDCECAIVGGVNLFLHPSRFIQYSQMKMQASSNLCCPFGDDANGTVFSEAVSALLLKPLKRAKNDNDHIYGVIKGISINSGGKTNGFTVPNPKAQSEMIKKALHNYQIPPSTIGYVEAHGTGTALGDPIEVKGLTEAFGQMDTGNDVCRQSIALGSVKSNIGHSESAAALSGVIKVLLQMKYQMIVPSLNAKKQNHLIPFEETPFFVPNEVNKWEHKTVRNENGEEEIIPYRGSVSSFGAGGSNAYIILEEYRDKMTQQERAIPIFVLSAKTESSLKQYAIRMKEFLEKNEMGSSLGNLFYSLQIGREQMKYRLTFMGEHQPDIIKKINAYLDGNPQGLSIFSGGVQKVNHMHLSLGKSPYDKIYLKELLKAKDFEKIMALWILGVDIHWEAFYEKERISKMSLPLYPFEERSCWLPQLHEEKTEIKNETEMTAETDRFSYLPFWNRTNTNFNTEKECKNLLILYGRQSYGFEGTIEETYRAINALVRVTKVLTDDVISTEHFSMEHYDAIYYLCDFCSRPEDSSSQSYEEIKLIHVIKKLKPHLQDQPIDFYVITKDTVRVTDDAIQQNGAGLAGLAYAIAHCEYRLAVRNIDLSKEDLETEVSRQKAAKLLYMMPVFQRGEQVKILNGIPYTQNFVRMEDIETKPDSVIKEHGVYVLLGGSGTVGRVLTRFLTDRYCAKVVWIGKSEKNSESVCKKLKEYRDDTLSYYQCDIVNHDEIIEVVNKIKTQFKKINGAIFMGQAISYENSIYQTGEEEFKQIFNVKSIGIRNFYDVFRDTALDFMCIFSSAQAFSFSNAGNLCAYASGVTDSDAYIKSVMNQTKFPLGIINWGFWKESALDTRMSKSISSLENTEGIECFLRFIGLLTKGVVRQMVCIKASQPILELMNYRNEVFYLNKNKADVFIRQDMFEKASNEYDLVQLEKIYQHTEIHQWMVRLLFIKLYQTGMIALTGSNRGESDTKIDILPKYGRLLIECIDILKRYRYISEEEDKSLIVQNREVAENYEYWLMEWEEQKELLMEDLQWGTKIRLFDTCMEHLEDILTGVVQATEIIFPDSSMEMLENVYKSNVIADFFNTAVADSIVAYIEEKLRTDQTSQISILEVGAGTGGTSAAVFRIIAPYQKHITYYYTDVSKAFLVYAKEKYGKESVDIHYGILNAEEPISRKDFPVGAFDIVLSTNCLHATKNINLTIRNIKSLLKKQGILIVNEEVKKTVFTTLTFGLLDGWWMYQDYRSRIEGAPLMYAETWNNVLKEEGFETIIYPVENAICLGQQVMIGQSNGVIRNVFNEQAADDVTATIPKDNRMKDMIPIAKESNRSDEREHIRDIILSQLSEVLLEDLDSIDEDAIFYEYGVDSIIGIAFINRINKILHISLNSAVLFNYVTVNQLVNYIFKHFESKKICAVNDQELNHLEKEFEKGSISVDDLISLVQSEG